MSCVNKKGEQNLTHARIPTFLIGVVFLIAAISCDKRQNVDVRGRLVVASTKQPFSGFGNTLAIPINLTDSSGQKGSRKIEIDQVQPDGGFLLNIPASTKELTFLSGPVNTRNVTFTLNTKDVDPSGVIDIGDVPLHVKNMARVRVMGPDNKPLKRADVRLTQMEPNEVDRAATTNENGEFTFCGFSSGSAKLTATAYRDRGHDWVDDIDSVTTNCSVRDALVTDIEVRFSSEK